MWRYRAANPDYVARERQNTKTYNQKHKERRLAYVSKRQTAMIEFINKFKDVPCKDCGNRFPSYVMDFDHVRGEKVQNVNFMGSYSLEAVTGEIEKCDVVCANCHRIRTYERNNH